VAAAHVFTGIMGSERMKLCGCSSSSLVLPLLLSISISKCWSVGDYQHASLVTVRFEDILPEKIGHPLPYLHYPHFLYNRGIDDFPPEYNVIIELSNVGREGFIYLKHIYHHYHNLSEITIFSQYDHVMNIDCPVVKAIMSGHTLHKKNDGFAFVGEDCMDMSYRPFVEGYEDYGTKLEDALSHIEKVLGPKYLVPNPRFVPTGFFAVTKEAIHRNPRSFYRDLARKLGSYNNPFEGHFLERAWPEVFLSKCSATEEFHCILSLGDKQSI
jgi:hypothetical protein